MSDTNATTKLSAIYTGKAGVYSTTRIKRIEQDIDMGRQLSLIDCAWLTAIAREAILERNDVKRRLYITGQIIDRARLSLEAVMPIDGHTVKPTHTADAVDIDIALQDGHPEAIDTTQERTNA